MNFPTPPARSASAKLLTSLSVFGVAACFAGLGSATVFTGSALASHSVPADTATVALGTSDSTHNRLTLSAVDVAEGDDPARRDAHERRLARLGIRHPHNHSAHLLAP